MSNYRGSVDALDDAIMAAFCSSAGPKPGVVIQQLRPETRDLLRELTSDQARDQRPRWLPMDPKFAHRQIKFR